MPSLKRLACAFLALDLVAIFVFIASYGSTFHGEETQFIEDEIESKFFLNKQTALTALSQLINFTEMPAAYYKLAKPPRKVLDATYLRLKRDPDYCQKVLTSLVDTPDVFFTQLNFVTDYLSDSMMREKLIPELGKDLMPEIDVKKISAKQQSIPKYQFHPLATVYFYRCPLQHHHELGKEVGCLFQAFNHVPGVGSLARKDLVGKSGNLYADRYKDRPQCYDSSKFFPKTMNLDNETECMQWFDYINSDAYVREKENQAIVFIRKIGFGSHQGAGVQPVDEDEEQSLRKQYKNGSLCGKNLKSVIIQRYIHNPLLVLGHKFDFRIYMMIASTNPLIVYYHDGFLRVSLFEYDINKKEKGMHLTNTAQSLKAIEKAKQAGMSEEELLNFQMWNLTRFADYLVAIEKIKSRAWLDEYLRPSFQNAMQHLVRMSQQTFYSTSTSWTLCGMDFMLDEDLNLWFIEANTSPVLEGSNKEKEIFITKMVKDMLEVVTAYLKSRLKRAIKYVNWLEKSGLIMKTEEGEVVVDKLEQRQQEFAEITKNYLDPEFVPNESNGWKKIIDENYDGIERYNGMIGVECFDAWEPNWEIFTSSSVYSL